MQARSRRIASLGLAAGPLLAVAAWWALPATYTGSDGELLELSRAGRATA